VLQFEDVIRIVETLFNEPQAHRADSWKGHSPVYHPRFSGFESRRRFGRYSDAVGQWHCVEQTKLMHDFLPLLLLIP